MSSPTAKKCLIFISVLGALVIISSLLPLHYGSLGAKDFIQYWRSWRMMLEGLNPYDSVLASAFQDKITATPSQLIVSWNPPWTYVLLSPILAFPFENAATLWMTIQFLLLATIAIVLPQALETPRSNVALTGVASILFFPVLSSLYFGQLGVLLATSVALFLYFQRRGLFTAAGLSLVPLSIKPHLFLLFIVPALLWLTSMPRKHALQLISGCCGGFAALLACSYAINPSAMSDWIHAFSSDPTSSSAGVGIPYQFWQTTTLATWVRIFLNPDAPPVWPMRVIPLTAFPISALYFLTKKGAIIWKDITPPLLCLSLLTSSYGWIFDQSILVITQLAVVCGALNLPKRGQGLVLIALAFLVQGIAICLSDFPQHYFVWMPIALLALLSLQRGLERRSSNG